MPIDFPNSPSINQQYSYNGTVWQWNGSAWIVVGTNAGIGNYVTTFNGLTGAVSGLTTGSVGGTYGSIQYKSAEGLCGSQYFTIGDDPNYVFKNTILKFIGPTGEDGIAANAQQGLEFSRVSNFLGLDEGGGPSISSSGYDSLNSGIANLFIGAVDGANDDLNSNIRFGFRDPITNLWTLYVSLDRNPTGDPTFSIANGCILYVDYFLETSPTSGSLFSGTITSNTGYRLGSSAINAQTGTTYSLLSTDNGKVITFNNASPITVTVPQGLGAGFSTTAIQLGAGQVGFTAASGVTLNAYSSAYKIAGQHGSASLISYATNIFNLSGSLNP